VHIPHTAGTRGSRDTTTRPTPHRSHRKHEQWRAVGVGVCTQHQYRPHDRPHQKARPNEQSEHTSASDDAPESPRCHAETARQDPDETPTPTGRHERERATTIYTHKRRHTTKPTTPNEQGITHAGARACPRTQTRDSHQRHNKIQPKTRARASDDLHPQATLRGRLSTSDGNFAPTSKASAKAERELTRECERPPRCSSTTTRTCLAV